MSRFISDILQAREPHFTQRILELEKIAGKPGVDLSLMSEMIRARKQITKNLGLDGEDTQPAELYHALVDKALADSNLLAEKIDITPADNPTVASEKVIKYVRTVTGDNSLWTLKSVSAKKQLRNNPPTKLMKIFSLRSIDSALKREPASLLMTFAKKTESNKWTEKYIAQSKKISPLEFGYQNIEISLATELRQSQLKKAGLSLNQVVYTNYDLGGIVVITPQKRFDGDVIFLVHSLLQNIKSLKSASLYLKLYSLQTNFPAKVESIRKFGFHSVAKRYDDFGWNSHEKHLKAAAFQNDSGVELMSDEDFRTTNISDLVSDGFWRNNYLLVPSQEFIVSCNLSDVILNAVNRYEPNKSHYHFGQRDLSDELYSRYLLFPAIRQHLEQSSE